MPTSDGGLVSAARFDHGHPCVRCAQGVLLGAALAACSLLLAACTTSRQVVLPGNPRAYVIDCSGASLSWSHCYQKAGQVCPHGYAVAKKPYRHGERIVAGDFLQLLGNSAGHRRMLIECKAADTHGQPPLPDAPPATR